MVVSFYNEVLGVEGQKGQELLKGTKANFKISLQSYISFKL